MCNELFKTKKDLDYHVDANHTEILMKKCHFCPMIFRERQVLYEHVFQKHSLAPILRATQCKYCGAKSDVDVLVELHNATCTAKLNGKQAAFSEEKIESTKKDTNPKVREGLGYFVGYRPSQAKAGVEVKALQKSETKNAIPSKKDATPSKKDAIPSKKDDTSSKKDPTPSKNETNPNQEKVEMEVRVLRNSENKNKIDSDEKSLEDSSKKLLRRRVGRPTKTPENITKSESEKKSQNVTESKTETENNSKDANFSANAAFEEETISSPKPAPKTKNISRPKRGKSNDKSDSNIGLYFISGHNYKYLLSY